MKARPKSEEARLRDLSFEACSPPISLLAKRWQVKSPVHRRFIRGTPQSLTNCYIAQRRQPIAISPLQSILELSNPTLRLRHLLHPPTTSSQTPNHLHPTKRTQPHQTIMGQIEPNPPISSLPSLRPSTVALHIQPPRDTPAHAQRARPDRVSQAGQHQRDEERRRVLDVVGVGALCAVEPMGRSVGARGWCVGLRVWDRRRFAEAARVGGV